MLLVKEKLSKRRYVMCESNAYLVKSGEEQLIMESVNLVRPQGAKTLLRSIFGEEMTVEGTLREMDLTGHRIVLEAV
jgi:predicted RNA-binding protein